MKPLSLAVPSLALFLACGGASANDAALLKCRAVTDVAARVHCYDAIPVGAATAPAAAPEQNFGMEAVKQREAQPKSVHSTIAGNFDGWGPGSQLRLANGQVWRITDGSEAVLPGRRDAAVTIERNAFGTLFLRVDGTNSSAKVRRIQ